MRRLTNEGWERVRRGLRLPQDATITTEDALWAWAIRQGAGVRLTAYLVFGMLGAEAPDFPGFREVHEEAHPVRFAWALDPIARAMVADFLVTPAAYMQ